MIVGYQHKLSDEAQAALDAVIARREAERTARARAEAKLAATLAPLERDLALAVAEARRLGVPHSRIGREGLGTKDWDAVTAWADRGEQVSA